MKTRILQRILPVCLLAMLIGCTQDNFINTGISNGRHDCSLLEYMKRHPYDWDSTVVMVKHAGLESLFENNELDGKHYEGITFFGVTNHSIRRYLLENGLDQVTDLRADMCRKVLLRCIVEGKIYRDDIPRGKESSGLSVTGEGGTTLTTIDGSKIWIYSFADSYGGVAGIGAVSLYGVILNSSREFQIASADIEPNNCVVHSFEYAVTIDDLLTGDESLMY